MPSLLSIARGSYGFGYDSTTGNLTSLTAPDGGALSFEYDGSLLTRLSATGEIAGSIAWTYDPDLAVTTETVDCASGGLLACEPVTFGYDQDKLLTAAGALTLARDPQNGRLTGTEAGIITDTWTYNALGEPEQYTARSGGAVIFEQHFTRDDAGRITCKVETVDGMITTYEYGYDDAGHLRDVTRNGAVVSHYEYDTNGNRILKSAPLVTETGNFDDQDRCASYGDATYAYAASGELETKTDATGTTQYEYDELGNLLHVQLPTGELIDYVIDASNRRVGKKVNGVIEERLIYSDELRPAAKLDANGDATARYAYGTRSNVPDLIITGDATYRVIADHLGSPRLVVNADTGEVVQEIEYDEFGNVTSDSTPGFQPFGFAGGLYDRDTDLTRFGARDYDPKTGRWTAKDPIDFEGGDSNLYGYTLNDPINRIDLDGLESDSITASINRAAARGDVDELMEILEQAASPGQREKILELIKRLKTPCEKLLHQESKNLARVRKAPLPKGSTPMDEMLRRPLNDVLEAASKPGPGQKAAQIIKKALGRPNIGAGG